MRVCYSLVFTALVAASTIAGAQHPIVAQKLSAWNAASPTPSLEVARDQVMKAATAAQKRGGGCLPTSADIETVSPATGVRFIFHGILAGRIRNGWTIVTRHPDCGNHIVRYTMTQDSAGNFSTIRTNRGQSYANESLIGDTWPLARLQAENILTRANILCDNRSADLGVTRVAKEEPGLGADVYGVRYTGSWHEVWPITLCGRTVEVGVRFTADGDGGAYNQLHSAEAKLLPASR
jgi:hypothetical protein